MTNLERLIQAHVEATTVTTVAATTDKVAEELAREILKDPRWRLRMRQLIEHYHEATIAELAKPANGQKPRRRQRKRKGR
jgi:hypothetical protein